jgi:adenine-specific DNA-methyltransferase
MAGEKSIATELGAVVLNFPFKECVLEGGMTTEEKKRSEIFYNQTLAPEEITRLFEPKVLTNFTRITAKTDSNPAIDSDKANETAGYSNPPPQFYCPGGSQSQLFGDAGRGSNNTLNNIKDKAVISFPTPPKFASKLANLPSLKGRVIQPHNSIDSSTIPENKILGEGYSAQQFNHQTDNLLIKGNNLLALYSLLPKYRGKVKLIYIDPPYNTGNDGFKYNDNFNHSTWLIFGHTMTAHQRSANAKLRARKLSIAGFHEALESLGQVLLYAIARFVGNTQ